VFLALSIFGGEAGRLIEQQRALRAATRADGTPLASVIL
jgi:hypothetical protein